jgi:hypothetical protein
MVFYILIFFREEVVSPETLNRMIASIPPHLACFVSAILIFYCWSKVLNSAKFSKDLLANCDFVLHVGDET